MSNRARTVLLGTTILAGLGVATPALAQEQMETVVVTGIRASLQSAQAIKQNSDQVVDSITAVDIGALPDRSVAEALQRIPGVQITRTDAQTDPLRWAGYGNGVFVRGLAWVQSTTNGEEVFGAENGRTVSFADISSDLMKGVDLYKNPDATMIEGGIGGVINLKTRMPFDFEGLKMAASANIDYDTLGDKATGSFNALISDRFNTRLGEIGVLVSADYQNLISTNALVSVDPWKNNGKTPAGDAVIYPKGYTNTYGMIGYKKLDWKQPRIALDATVQWRPSESLEVTFTTIFSKAEPQSMEHNVGWMVPSYTSSSGVAVPYAASFDSATLQKTVKSYTYDEGGFWTGGTLYNATSSSTQATYFDTRFDARHHINKTFQLQAKWNPTSHLEVDIDGYYLDSRATMNSITMYNEYKSPMFRSWSGSVNWTNWWPNATPANVAIDISGDTPRISYNDAGVTMLGTQSNALWAANMDHVENNYAHAYVQRGDATYSFDGDGLFGIVKKLQAGYRLNWKQANTRASGWNWGRVGFKSWGYGGCAGTPADIAANATAAVRTASCVANIPDFANVNSDNVQLYKFGEVFGQTMPNVWEPKSSWMSDPYQVWKDTQKIEAMPIALGQDGAGLWQSLTTKFGNCTGVLYKCEYPYLGANGANSTSGVSNQKENTFAGYFQVDYGRDTLLGFEVPFDGNIGVRVVRTEYDSGAGYLQLPKQVTLCPAYDTTTNVYNGPCDDWNSTLTFLGTGNGGNVPYAPVTHAYTHVLPSFNFRAALSEKLQLRAAYSQALVRPPLADMRNYAAIAFHYGKAPPVGSGLTDLQGTYLPTGENPFTGTGANPYLKPTFAHNYDLSLEWYFAPTGNVALGLFHKTISNYILSGQTTLTVSRNGISHDFNMGTFGNGDHGTVEGLEFQYTQMYDTLPGALGGLGLQFNYTKLYNHGGRNSLAGYADANAATYAASTALPMENMSPDSMNAALLYEKYGISARIAYNWRSTFLVNSYAVNLFQPVFQRNYGQVDTSILYTFLDNYKIGFQVANLFKQSTILQIGDNKAAAHSFEWVQGERKLSLVLRASL